MDRVRAIAAALATREDGKGRAGCTMLGASKQMYGTVNQWVKDAFVFASRLMTRMFRPREKPGALFLAFRAIATGCLLNLILSSIG